jgi:glycosyltransferase involved in cell wall biosynthesis
VANYYQAVDIYVHAAKAETFGLAITEALACGTPVVATAVCGIPEQINHGETGFLVPQGNAEQMAIAIVTILNNSKLQQKMSEQAVQLAHNQYSLDRMVNNYLEWYQEILDK